MEKSFQCDSLIFFPYFIKSSFIIIHSICNKEIAFDNVIINNSISFCFHYIFLDN